MDLSVNKVLAVNPEIQDHQDLLVIMDYLDLKELMVHPVELDHPETLVIPV